MKVRHEEMEKVLDRFIIGPRGFDMCLGGQNLKNVKLGPSHGKRRSSARVTHENGKGGVTKGKGKSSKVCDNKYARVAYDYGKDEVPKVKKRKSTKVHHVGIAMVDESPREVIKVKIPKVRKRLWDPW